MKQSVTTSTIFKAILAFTFFFAAFIALTITYNKVYKVKNETMSIIEKYEGVSKKSLKLVNNYLNASGYRTKGECKTGEYGVANLNNNLYEPAKDNTKYYYCISYYCAEKGCKLKDKKAPNGNQIFFKVRLFYKFNLPFMGDLFIFDITGETKAIKLYDENQKLY